MILSDPFSNLIHQSREKTASGFALPLFKSMGLKPSGCNFKQQSCAFHDISMLSTIAGEKACPHRKCSFQLVARCRCHGDVMDWWGWRMLTVGAAWRKSLKVRCCGLWDFSLCHKPPEICFRTKLHINKGISIKVISDPMLVVAAATGSEQF